MPSLDFVYKFLLENFEDVYVRGNQFTARCAICGDSLKSKRKRRFGLKYNDKNTVYNCYNCNSSGSFYKLYSIVKKIPQDDAYRECEPGLSQQFANIPERLLNSLYTNNKEKPEQSHNFNDILKDCITQYNYEPGIINESYAQILKDFRESRCLDKNLPLFYAYKGRFQGRIIIPVFDIDGNIVYFQGRSTNSSIQPKYLNPVFEREVVIPNFHLFDITKPVIIVEGLLDCYSIGPQSTACLGASIDDNFLTKIKTRSSGIIIAMDNDEAGRKAAQKIIEHSKFGRELKYFVMPYKNIKDINQLLVETEQQNINMYEFISSNSFSYLKLKK